MMITKQFLMSILLSQCLSLVGQTQVNYDEDAIQPYTLPELLTLENGESVKTIEDWETNRRPQILSLYKNQVFGNIPAAKISSTIEVVEQSDLALGNTAVRKQIAIELKDNNKTLTINILLYLPKDIKNPHIFLGYNFYGNQSIIDDPNVILSDAWVRNNEDFGITTNKQTEASRGKRSSRWPVQKIISEGFGLATIYYGDVDPDKPDFSDGIHHFYYDDGQSQPQNGEWGSIAAWAWGMSRCLDYLKTNVLLKESKFIAFGHSRLGKTSLWAGSLDDRFDIVISNNSGCGGAALSRRRFGETVSIINQNFPHWFTDNFKQYSHNEASLPIDQHMLIALMAPRPVYIASAEDDRWADPYGEYLSGYHASSIYDLYGKEGLRKATPPIVNTPIHTSIGYHVRSGGHNVTDYDWEQFMSFARQHLD